jgi:hypothetical protein
MLLSSLHKESCVYSEADVPCALMQVWQGPHQRTQPHLPCRHTNTFEGNNMRVCCLCSTQTRASNPSTMLSHPSARLPSQTRLSQTHKTSSVGYHLSRAAGGFRLQCGTVAGSSRRQMATRVQVRPKQQHIQQQHRIL